MRRLIAGSILSVAVLAGPAAVPLCAQGALATQGFGYPTGQLSTRAAATAGALGETDPGSAINPAALLAGGRSIFSFQFDPEFRSVIVNGRDVGTVTMRFPLVTAGFQVFGKGYVGASFSSLLDRTWAASYNDSVTVGGDRVRSTVTTSVKGAIEDARLAFAWTFSDKLQAGLGVHAITGANRLALSRVFTDSGTFGALAQSTTLSYSGSAVSAGVVATPVAHLLVAASLRLGRDMRARYGDSVATTGNVPGRYGIAVVYDGIPGSQLAVRYGREQWSRMRSMGSAALSVRDASDLSVGADMAGPKVQGLPMQFRVGARSRDLPFGWNGHAVKESSLAAGGQLPLARGWAAIDVGVQRATRTAGSIRERATMLSVGITVRP